MANEEPKNQIEASGAWRASIQTGGGVGAIVPQDFDAVWRLANIIGLSRMCPKDFDTPEKVAVAIMHGMEVGLSPMAAMQSIAVVNGRPSLWGDAVLGLVRSSGLLESFKEELFGEGDKMKAVCTVKRKGDPETIISEFSVEDAKKANLWGKSGPWSQYPKRMLKMRARGFGLRDGFPDVLRGLHVAEEQQDIITASAPAVEEPPSPPAKTKPKKQVAAKPVAEEAEIVEQDPPSPAAKEEEPQTEQSYGEFETLGEYMQGLEIALDRCEDEAQIEEIWTEFDPMAIFQDDEDSQQLAVNMKAKAIDGMRVPSGPLFKD